MDSTQTDILRVLVDNHGNLQLIVSLWILFAAALIFVVYKYLRRKSWLRNDFEVNEAKIGIGKSSLSFRPNLEDHQIAYKLWVELYTRKIGLQIDFEHDVIAEIYDSWYEFFRITRELIKEIPISKVRQYRSTRQLVRISTEVLNQGMRPHLTTWQARFRTWYKDQLERSAQNEACLFPQDIQKDFPQYDLLIADMKDVNDKLIEYRSLLEELWKSGVKTELSVRNISKRQKT